VNAWERQQLKMATVGLSGAGGDQIEDLQRSGGGGGQETQEGSLRDAQARTMLLIILLHK